VQSFAAVSSAAIPWLGSDQTGLAAARAELFEGAVSIVTPDQASDPMPSRRSSILEGSRLACFFKSRHLSTITLSLLISHLPHLLAAALVNTVATKNFRAFDSVVRDFATPRASPAARPNCGRKSSAPIARLSARRWRL